MSSDKQPLRPPLGVGRGGASGVSQTQALLLPGAPFLKAYG